MIRDPSGDHRGVSPEITDCIARIWATVSSWLAPGCGLIVMFTPRGLGLETILWRLRQQLDDDQARSPWLATARR